MAAIIPAPLTKPVVDPSIFTSIQHQIDEDSTLREELRTILKNLDRHHRALQLVLSSAHTLRAADLGPVLQAQTPTEFLVQRQTVQELRRVAGKYPYYKYCSLWGREIQNAVCLVLSDFRRIRLTGINRSSTSSSPTGSSPAATAPCKASS